jgi:hypothetical protein
LRTNERTSGRWVAYTHLSVLFIAPEQHVGCRLEGKMTHLVLLDNGVGWYVRVALRRWRWGGLRIDVSAYIKEHKNEANLCSRRRVFEPLVTGVIYFPPKIHRLRGFTERIERH